MGKKPTAMPHQAVPVAEGFSQRVFAVKVVDVAAKARCRVGVSSRSPARADASMFHDLTRLISVMDVLQYVGDLIYKRSLRYTGLTAVVSLVGYLGNFLPGVETYNAKVAIALPLLVGSSMLAGGLTLKAVPALLAVRAINVAQAQDLDLMEDYRKSRQEEHLKELWERVFRYEWAVGSAASRVHEHPEEAPPEVCRPQPPAPDSADQARQEFLARARFALARPQPQARQRYHLGLDLRFLEDWRNGGFFDRGDVKLQEQFEASAAIVAVKREVGYGRWAALRDLPIRLYQKCWFGLIVRAVAIQVGDTISWLNRRFQTDWFNAQVLLWPGEDQQPWLEPFRWAADDLRQRRRLLLVRIFGDDLSSARRMLRRMLWPGFWLASKLRAAYDPEYLDGSLGYDLLADFQQMEISPARIAFYRRLSHDVAAEQAALGAWLRRFRPELLTPEHAESLRAARIAVHLARHRLRRFLMADPHDAKAAESFVDQVLDLVDVAVRAKDRYSARLVSLRMHHELTRLHYHEYMDLLDRLWEGCL